jgi:hypothetical protein
MFNIKKVEFMAFVIVLVGVAFFYAHGLDSTGNFISDDSINMPPKEDTYSTALFSYSHSICDEEHNQGLTEEQIFSMYDIYILGEDSLECIDDDSNKQNVFLYVDVWGKHTNVSADYHIIPAPVDFITENFPDGHGSIPTNIKSNGGPFCFIQTDEYFDDLYNLIDEWLYNITYIEGYEIGGLFLDDWLNAAAYWSTKGNPPMTQEDMDRAWPGRSIYTIPWEHHPDNPDATWIWTNEDAWWQLEQLPRLYAFEERLHDLFVSYYGESRLIVNGNYRKYRSLPGGGHEPWFYGNSDYTPLRTTHRCFEGPTVNGNKFRR